MPDWTPPLDTGLAEGDAMPEDDVATHTADGTLDAAHRPGVYALRLSTPADAEAYHRLWAEQYDVDHPDLAAMIDATRVYYVGAAADVYGRLCQHLRAPNQSAAVCRVFPIHSVARVWWYADRDDAFTRESGHAADLRNDGPFYVSQN